MRWDVMHATEIYVRLERIDDGAKLLFFASWTLVKGLESSEFLLY